MKHKEYLIILISLLLIAVLWVGFNIYHNYTTSNIDPNDNMTVIPINKSFDQDTINQIKNRKRVDVKLDSIKNAPATPSPTITITPTVTASSSPTISPTPSR